MAGTCRRVLGLVLAALLAVSVAPRSIQSQQLATTRPTPNPLASVTQELQALLDRIVAEHTDVPSVALHVEAPRLHVSWTGVAGVLDPKTAQPIQANTVFRMASNTKTYTAATILRLWEMGRLHLDDVLTKHLPPDYVSVLRAGGYAPEQITLRHLLSHSSGLYDWGTDSAYGARVFAEPKHRWSRMEQVRFAMDHGKPYGKPGEVYHYTDTGYILLGEIIERVSGVPMANAFRSLLHYDKLGLRSTWLETLEPTPHDAGERAHQLQGPADSYEFDPSLDLWGGGGNLATVHDMAIFTRALFVGGVYSKPHTIDTMLTKFPARDNKDYRFGIHASSIDGLQAFGHTGYWNTFADYFPDIDVAVAGAVAQNAQYRVATQLLHDAVVILHRASVR